MNSWHQKQIALFQNNGQLWCERLGLPLFYLSLTFLRTFTRDAGCIHVPRRAISQIATFRLAVESLKVYGPQVESLWASFKLNVRYKLGNAQKDWWSKSWEYRAEKFRTTETKYVWNSAS